MSSEMPLMTARLALEPIVAAHAPRLFPSLSDERLYTYIPEDPPASVAALRQRYERWSGRRSPDGTEVWLNWALRLRLGTEYVGVVQATARADGSALLAYMLFAAFQGKGYGREACSRVLEHLATDHGARLAIAEIDTRNQRSIALVESLGFVRAATTRAADYFKGVSSDEYRYELRLAHDELAR